MIIRLTSQIYDWEIWNKLLDLIQIFFNHIKFLKIVNKKHKNFVIIGTKTEQETWTIFSYKVIKAIIHNT